MPVAQALRKGFAPVRERERPYGAHSFVLSGGSPAALCGGGTAGGLSAPTAFLHSSPHPSGLGIFSFAAEPCLTPAVPYPARAFLRHASHSLPHSASPAAPDISLRARLYFAECRVFRNAAQLPPSASPWPHTRFSSTLVRASPSLTLLRIAAQSLTAVLDVFSCARRGRPFPPCPTTPRRLRTPDSSALRLFSAAVPSLRS